MNVWGSQGTGTDDWYTTCSHTVKGEDDTPGYWFVQFRDGQPRYVPQIRLWNRNDDCHEEPCQWRLNGACIRFSTNGTMPDPSVDHHNATDCTAAIPASDAQLPDIDSSHGAGSGTVVPINRNITGMMFLSNKELVGVHPSATSSTTTTSTSTCTVALDVDTVPLLRAIQVSMTMPPGFTIADVATNEFLQSAAATYAQYLSAKMSEKMSCGVTLNETAVVDMT
eukprot:g19938.t1